MKKPLVIGMGPTVDYPTFGWHPAAPATRVISWAALDKWDALFELREKIDLLNLNSEFFADERGKDALDPDQAGNTLRRMLFTNVLTDNRLVILLGEQVTRFIGSALGVLTWPPRSDLPLEPTPLDDQKDGYRYSFRAIPAWHPSGIWRQTAVERNARAQLLREVMHEAVGMESNGSKVTDFRPPPTIVDGSYTRQEFQDLELEFFGGRQVHWTKLLSSEKFHQTWDYGGIEANAVEPHFHLDQRWSDTEEHASYDEVESGIAEYYENNESGWWEKD